MTVRVLVVDDSAVVRQMLERELETDREIEVVGTAPDPYAARDKIVELKPDVVTLDIEMPRMDGLSFLKKLMKHFPIPVIIVSSLAEHGSQVAMDAMASGAVDVMCKPNGPDSVGDIAIELCEKIKAAARVNVKQMLSKGVESTAPVTPLQRLTAQTEKILVIGSSTGGVQAIEEILRKFPENAPGTVITQHMPPGFTNAFARRLNGFCSVEVREAKDGDQIKSGVVLIAPGGFHTMIRRVGESYFVDVRDGPLVNKHKPSVEPLFLSAAKYLGKSAIGVMLTGMGADGAKAMKSLKDSGAINIAQDEKSSVVYGMPRAAVEAGAVDFVLPLSEIASRVLELAKR